MKRLGDFLATILFGLVAISSSSGIAEEIRDVTFSTPYMTSRPQTADFYYNDRAVGRGRDGFQAIVERIGKLPAGTSIAWGPNFGRCGACSPNVPKCVPKHLYPDQWTQLEKEVATRGLTLSSNYPNVHQKRVEEPGVDELPEVIALERQAAEPGEMTFDWEIGESAASRREVSPGAISFAGRQHRISSAGHVLDFYDVELLLNRLADGSRVCFRISVRENPAGNVPAVPRELLIQSVRATWQLKLGPRLRPGGYKATLIVPPDWVDHFHRKPDQEPLTIGWTNFHGPGTPHDEVLYQANHEFVGRGTAGFGAVLERLRQRPMGSTVRLTKYGYSGRWAADSFSPSQLKAENERLASVVPFAEKRPMFDRLVSDRQLKLDEVRKSPSGKSPRTVHDWDHARTDRMFVTIGRIVRHDEKPRPATARLGWIGFDAHQRLNRSIETMASYTLDDVELGQGVAGFAKAMDRLEELPAGSVVHVGACLRTKGPFLCPIIYEGHRHFERTGFEPCIGLFPWLIDVAQKGKLEIEWIPDEQKSCGDCELNR